MKSLVVSFCSGVVFAIGLGVSGMIWPTKVVGFLNIFGDWDPSLAFVMVGAIGVYAVGYRFAMKRPKPIFDNLFHLPTKKDLDKKLFLGSALFGVGWGALGYCPGPALTSLVSGQSQTLIFVAMMLLGMALHHFWEKAAL